MRVALVLFDGFDELGACTLLGLLERLRPLGWSTRVASPTARPSSMGGLRIEAQQALEWANEADAVLFGGGLYARAIAENSALLDRLQLDPLRQTLGAQCSGSLLLARLGLLGDMPACTDAATRPWLRAAGVRVVDTPFHARGPVATAGGSLAAPYLAAWLMLRGAGLEAARDALLQAAPVGEQEAQVRHLLAVVSPYLPADPGQPR